ncbi:MAG: aminotransferase [Alphaproteobacteria bacterium]|nr:MAG: aminotransferase [Alphaproteobacteria bacterium]
MRHADAGPGGRPPLAASSRSRIEPFRAMSVVARAGELAGAGRDIVLMCVGQPDAPAPLAAREAAARAALAGPIGYTASAGTPALRRRIARHYRERYGVEPDPARVYVTTGSSAGFILSFLAAFDAGDRVAIPAPGYPAYRNILRALSLEPVEIECVAADRWVITPALLEAAHARAPLAGLLVANPNNPNGTMLRPEAFHALVDAARALGIRLISDEIYHGLTFDMAETTALGLDEDAFVINSFSKFFCMTGWRVGWMVVPEAMIETVDRLQQNAFICAPEISQIAALAAFDGMAELEAVRRGYARNRALMLARLPRLGFGEVQPIDGAFYAYAEAGALADDTARFAARLLEEAGVAVTPGVDFDARRGRRWLRFSFAGDHGRIAEGLDRIEAWLGRQNR